MDWRNNDFASGNFIDDILVKGLLHCQKDAKTSEGSKLT
jgi:hypothetical protein